MAQTMQPSAKHTSMLKTACDIAGDARTLLRWTGFRNQQNQDLPARNTFFYMEGAETPS